MKQIAQIEKSYMKDDLPAFAVGDTVKVHVKIREGDKERLQVFQGTVISRRGGGTGETFTVRKISAGIGVERVFPVHSPNVSNIERIRQGKVRRAKLYYLRGLTGKSARITEKLVDKSTEKAEKKTKKPAKKAKAKAEPKAKAETKAKAEKKAEPKKTATKKADKKAE
ncbi:MAG: 50S ribosomal protein L19 [candidate division Zixibacteria bacterium]|nr:50S ribosomal protein L19 [candidate division Zixibacteria bacterium]